MTKAEFYAKLDPFLKLLESEMNERMKEQFKGLHESAIANGRRGYNHVGYDEGLRFVKVWTESGQTSVKYFVEKESGAIFGAKGWKAYNPNHMYGDLDTINEWAWGEFYATNKQGKPSLVPKAMRR